MDKRDVRGRGEGGQQRVKWVGWGKKRCGAAADTPHPPTSRLHPARVWMAYAMRAAIPTPASPARPNRDVGRVEFDKTNQEEQRGVNGTE